METNKYAKGEHLISNLYVANTHTINDGGYCGITELTSKEKILVEKVELQKGEFVYTTLENGEIIKSENTLVYKGVKYLCLGVTYLTNIEPIALYLDPKKTVGETIFDFELDEVKKRARMAQKEQAYKEKLAELKKLQEAAMLLKAKEAKRRIEEKSKCTKMKENRTFKTILNGYNDFVNGVNEIIIDEPDELAGAMSL